MEATSMHLKIFLPSGRYLDQTGVKRIVAETRQGLFGILPNRLDCVGALIPGILTYETEANGEVNIAVDAGILVKAGQDVRVSVRNAIGGLDLGELNRAIRQEFLALNEQEQEIRSILIKLETRFIRQFQQLQQE